MRPKKSYEAPVVRVVGSLQELTLAIIGKNSTHTPDGLAFNGTPLTS